MCYLLCNFDVVLKVKSEGKQTSSRWCRSRGVEQQRFYEMVKLRQQFREVLMVIHYYRIIIILYVFYRIIIILYVFYRIIT